MIFFVFQEFVDHFEIFEQKVQEIDHRLSTIILQAFYDCSGIEGMFKVVLDFTNFTY